MGFSDLVKGAAGLVGRAAENALGNIGGTVGVDINKHIQTIKENGLSSLGKVLNDAGEEMAFVYDSDRHKWELSSYVSTIIDAEEDPDFKQDKIDNWNEKLEERNDKMLKSLRILENLKGEDAFYFDYSLDVREWFFTDELENLLKLCPEEWLRERWDIKLSIWNEEHRVEFTESEKEILAERQKLAEEEARMDAEWEKSQGIMKQELNAVKIMNKTKIEDAVCIHADTQEWTFKDNILDLLIISPILIKPWKERLDSWEKTHTQPEKSTLTTLKNSEENVELIKNLSNDDVFFFNSNTNKWDFKSDVKNRLVYCPPDFIQNWYQRLYELNYNQK